VWKNMSAVMLMAHLIFWPAAAAAAQVFDTPKTAIIFDQYRDLTELSRRLGASGPAGEPHLGAMSARIDGMLGEISEVLQRRPLRPSRLQIRLLKNGCEVRQQQTRLTFPRKGMLGKPRPLESCYDPRRCTIFLSLADARLGVLAHEMTHFILCESYRVPPSEAYQEAVANYLERRFNAKPSDFSY
jgi:hypothetical protein